MSQWWVFHEDKVEKAIKAWLDEVYPEMSHDAQIVERASAREEVESFLNSAALKRLGMRKE